tara:strand:- start:194 stop:532 length:339 start_codon:yes stop_codon:yes gene_type:complete
MPTPARNTAISKPRSFPRRPNIHKIKNSGFLKNDSVMNSHFSMNLFGSANSSNRKQGTYTNIAALSTGSDTAAIATEKKDPNKEIRQASKEANVGQMDRLNRLKAVNIYGSK